MPAYVIELERHGRSVR